MPYLVDSDWVIDHLAEKAGATELLAQLSDGGIAISIITYMEVFQGVERSRRPSEAQARFQALVDAVPVAALSLAVARRCARLREALRRQRKRVNSRGLDLIIAATALEHDLILVTRNAADYDDIPGLKLYSGLTGGPTMTRDANRSYDRVVRRNSTDPGTGLTFHRTTVAATKSESA